jgi:16S rRNA (guanine(527)-N(7))-methyltransferase RsmG
MNLTAIQAPSDVLKILLAESFFSAVLVKEPKGPILDIGSGAGVPGLAMAIYRPELELILLEPRKKRAAFMAALRRELGLSRVSIWKRRLEECAPNDFSELPTVLTMRAVAETATLVQCGIRFLQGPRSILLFSSTKTARPTMDGIAGVCWQPPRVIPWNSEHLVLFGQVERHVPRETMSLQPTSSA